MKGAHACLGHLMKSKLSKLLDVIFIFPTGERCGWSWDNAEMLPYQGDVLHGRLAWVFLVDKDSPDRCILEHAAKLLYSFETVPLTLSSHPGLGLLEGPAFKTKDEGVKGRSVCFKRLAIGYASEALSAWRDGESIRVFSKFGSDRVLHVPGPRRYALLGISDQRPICEPPDHQCPCRSFCINDDGTVAPAGFPNLVLGVHSSSVSSSVCLQVSL